MRVLVDTTYLLPAIGVSVRGIPAKGTINLIQKGHEIHASEISIFELSAIGAKHICAGTLLPERVTRGIRAIVHDATVRVIPFHESELLLTAFKLRTMLRDFIDRLILASAIIHCDMLVTEDDEIKSLEKDKEFRVLYTRTNPRFTVQAISEIT